MKFFWGWKLVGFGDKSFSGLENFRSLIWTNCKYANKLSFQESSDSSSLNSFQKSLYCCEVKVARVISFSQPQHVAQIIDLAAQWKRVELTLKNCPNNSKVYFNVAQNGLIQYRNVQKTSLF